MYTSLFKPRSQKNAFYITFYTELWNDLTKKWNDLTMEWSDSKPFSLYVKKLVQRLAIPQGMD